MIRILQPKERLTRVRPLTRIAVGFYMGQSAHLSRTTRAMPLVTKQASTVARFRRFVHNKAFRIRAWYKGIG